MGALLESIKQKKFRCSSLSSVCAGFKVGLTEKETLDLAALNQKYGKTKLTEKQEEKMFELLKKDSLTKKQEEELLKFKENAKTPLLTDKQLIQRAKLIEKRDKPAEISDGARTYLRKLIDEVIMGRSLEATSAAMEKGTLVEGVSLSLFQNVNNFYVQKNEKTFDHHPHFRGTPDSFIGSDTVLDIKSSWRYDKFPLTMETIPSVYLYQLLAYCILTERERAVLAYCLVDTPHHLIDDDLRRLSWKLGVTSTDSLPKDIIVENVMQHIFTEEGLHEYVHQSSFIEMDWFVGKFKEIPEQNRLRLFDILLTDEKREHIEKACEVAKEVMVDMYIALAENYQRAEEMFFIKENKQLS